MKNRRKFFMGNNIIIIEKRNKALKNLRTIGDLKEFLKGFFRDEKVEIYLFGSKARRDNTPFSDVDIGFLANKNISSKLTVLKEILEESNFPYKVDLVELTSNSELMRVVLEEGERWRRKTCRKF